MVKKIFRWPRFEIRIFSSCNSHSLPTIQYHCYSTSLDKYHRSYRLFKLSTCLSCSVIIRFSSLRNLIFSIRYDSDANHEPCLKQGHRAHWLLVHGYLKSIDSPSNDLVLIQHGKSKHLAAFSLQDLFQSNGQLIDADLKRRNQSEYCVPQDGSLRDTLCNFFIAI